MNFKWLVDPRSKEQSVPLTMLVITFIILIAVNIAANVLHKMTVSTASLENMFFGLLVLYWGHGNLKIGDKNYSSEENKE